jgi:hypothetical protein
MGVKLMFVMLLMVSWDDIRLFVVAASGQFARCQWVGESEIGPSYETSWLLRSQLCERHWKPVGC